MEKSYKIHHLWEQQQPVSKFDTEFFVPYTQLMGVLCHDTWHSGQQGLRNGGGQSLCKSLIENGSILAEMFR